MCQGCEKQLDDCSPDWGAVDHLSQPSSPSNLFWGHLMLGVDLLVKRGCVFG